MVERRDLVGQQFGNYLLLRLLEQGTFAMVYLGKHQYLERLAAIKVLHVQMEAGAHESFRREARTIAQLRHPHIVGVHDFGFEGQTPYLVMEYMPNGTLRSQCPRGTRLSFEQIVTSARQIASALDYAHKQHVIHRDVKPENILLGTNYEIVLSDFGIAVVQRQLSSLLTQSPAGTPIYMAPEQIQHNPCAASDQYALGVMVYEWLCGEPPFQGSLYEVWSQHLHKPPPSLCARVKELPPAVEDAVFRTLAKEPENRFPTVQDFATALDEAFSATQPLGLRESVGHEPPERATLSAPHDPSVSTRLSSEQELSNMVPPVPLAPQRQTVVTTPPSALSKLPPLPQTTAKPVVARRAVLIGAASVVTIVTVGTAIFALAQRHPQVIPPHQTVPPPTPTVIPHYQPLTYRGHSDKVRSVAWSPDGLRIASGSWDNTVRVWNATDGSEVFTYTGHTDSVWSVAWSPDGKWIASGSRDHTVQVWSASDGRKLFIYTGHAANDVNTVAWSPDGKRIASGSDDKTIQVWNASDGSNAYTYTGHTELIWSVAWSPDSKWIASASRDYTAQVWKASGGNKVFIYRGHIGAVKAVAWSPDGKRIASGSDDKTAQVWNASDGSNVLTYKRHTNTVWSLAWSPDSKRLASGSLDKTVQVWSPGDESNVFTYTGHTDLVGSVAWSPYGKWVASGSADKTVQVWQVV